MRKALFVLVFAVISMLGNWHIALAVDVGAKFGISTAYLWKGVELMDSDSEAFSLELSKTSQFSDKVGLRVSARAVLDDEYDSDRLRMVYSKMEAALPFSFNDFKITPYTRFEAIDTMYFNDDNFEFGLEAAKIIAENEEWQLEAFSTIFTDAQGDDAELDYSGIKAGIEVNHSCSTPHEIADAIVVKGFAFDAYIENVDFAVSKDDEYTHLSTSIQFNTDMYGVTVAPYIAYNKTLSGQNAVKALSSSKDFDVFSAGLTINF